MAKLFILFALCVLPALVSSTRLMTVKNPFLLQGKVFCDTCKLGYETPKSTYIPGAKIRVECKDKDTLKVVYSVEAVTNKDGLYQVTVSQDHGDEICDAVLVSSPQKDCASAIVGSEKARVILTNNNGIISNKRYANNLGFVKDTAIEGCDKLIKLYEEEV